MIDWGLVSAILAAAVVVLAAIAWRLRRVALNADREAFIRHYVFSTGLFDKLREKHPQLTIKDCQLVARALREFFLAHLRSGYGAVGMPSRVVDDLWHAFILDTKPYTLFCHRAFGRYFHHLPASRPGTSDSHDKGLRLTWRYACRSENIDPRKPTRLPLLFAIDEKLEIAGGHSYTLAAFEHKVDPSGSSCAGGCTGGGCSGSSGCSGGGCGGSS